MQNKSVLNYLITTQSMIGLFLFLVMGTSLLNTRQYRGNHLGDQISG
jgi:hypothetical protein